MEAWTLVSHKMPERRQTVIVCPAAREPLAFPGWRVTSWDGVDRWMRYEPTSGLTVVGCVSPDDSWMAFPKGRDA